MNICKNVYQPNKGACNCDAYHDLEEDSGILSNKNDLPIMQLNYGAGDGRFSFIAYQLGFLECTGKADVAEYPSDLPGFKDLEKFVKTNSQEIEDLNKIIDKRAPEKDYHFKYGRFDVMTRFRYIEL